MTKRNIIIVILAIGLVVGLYYGTKVETSPEKTNTAQEENVEKAPEEKADEKPSAEEELAVGKPAPKFTLKDLNGKDVSLSDYKGKIVLINFWATWCAYCDMEMPDLEKLNKENDDLVVLAVNVREGKDIVEKYIKEGKYTFPVALDESGDVSAKYLVSAFPTTYFVDKEGLLLGAVPGMMTAAQMDEIVGNIRAEIEK
ncbi:TlpA family protein disulfide reductase [Anaeromicrobium sediminis]|uniref:Alkyl hydroperoxide reductase n=1 Tax=Anaeromicrobium sediminis TaxID=1478221 RepID=A0A267MHN4_9FIRM|nr:TlpA disulfide reductase family protein [Anaeromicrobium sediminis]PAB58385.1 alkyl hydroperoxide reductase [Anaeromicrobium sediminis]